MRTSGWAQLQVDFELCGFVTERQVWLFLSVITGATRLAFSMSLIDWRSWSRWKVCRWDLYVEKKMCGIFFYFSSFIDRKSQVAPAELENLVRSLDGVADCAVLGVPHPRAGQVSYSGIDYNSFLGFVPHDQGSVAHQSPPFDLICCILLSQNDTCLPHLHITGASSSRCERAREPHHWRGLSAFEIRLIWTLFNQNNQINLTSCRWRAMWRREHQDTSTSRAVSSLLILYQGEKHSK